jgi:putative phosphoesterase
MLIGVISDTHIPIKAQEVPPQILEAFKKADLVVHAGDLVTLSVLESLKAVCPNVIAVWGNMDPEEVKAALPERKIFTAGKFKIALAHGWGPPDKLTDLLAKAFSEEKVDAVIFGHAHAPLNEKKGGILFFNPGSATDKSFAPYNSYGLIEISDKIEGRIIKI